MVWEFCDVKAIAPQHKSERLPNVCIAGVVLPAKALARLIRQDVATFMYTAHRNSVTCVFLRRLGFERQSDDTL